MPLARMELCQFGQALTLEHAPRLQRVRIDAVDRNGERRFLVWAGEGTVGCRAGRQQGAEALTERLARILFLFMVEDLFGQPDIAFGALGAGVVSKNGFAETGRLGQANAAGTMVVKTSSLKNSLRSAATWRVRFVRSSYMVRSIPSTCSGCWKASRIRSMVSISSETPSNAKNSHWMGPARNPLQ